MQLHKLLIFLFGIGLSFYSVNAYSQNKDSITVTIEPGSIYIDFIYGGSWYLSTIVLPDKSTIEADEVSLYREVDSCDNCKEERIVEDYWEFLGKVGKYKLKYRSIWGEEKEITVTINSDTTLFLPQMYLTQDTFVGEEDLYLVYARASEFSFALFYSKIITYTHKVRGKIRIYNSPPYNFRKHKRLSKKQLSLFRELEKLLPIHGFLELPGCGVGRHEQYEYLILMQGNQYKVFCLPCIYLTTYSNGTEEDPIRDLLDKFGVYKRLKKAPSRKKAH